MRIFPAKKKKIEFSIPEKYIFKGDVPREKQKTVRILPNRLKTEKRKE